MTEFEVDINGKPAPFQPGDRVLVVPLKMEATVIKQYLVYNDGDDFWGNVLLQYDDGVTGTSNCWQLRHIT